jgi:asparagine synthetase B (glutamine-hydrolysing)
VAATTLTPLELASGLVLGGDRRVSLPRPEERDPVAAFERALLPSLRRPPCLVSFSGGRDSSTVLTLAAALARREGLPAPVPATHVVASAAESDESGWQERVVRWLRLDDWVRIASDDELDVVGPVASAVLRRYGLLWPPNVHFHAPFLDAAGGGSLLTGIGGDEAFSASQWQRTAALAARAARPEPRDALRVGLALSPVPLRRAVLRRRAPDGFAWLRPDARAAVRRALADEAAREPLRWRARVRWLAGLRYLEVGTTSLKLLAADAQVRLVHPFTDRGFLASIAALGRDGRFLERTEGLRAVFGGLVPDDVLARRTKASFDGAFWNRHSRAFAAGWSGEGVDADLVDTDALRREWAQERPDARTFTLLQAAWLAANASAGRDRVEQPLAGVGH